MESGIGANVNIAPDALITAARTKYNNIDQRVIWNKFDPRDSQIMALTTMVETNEGNKKPTINGNGGTVLSVNAQDARQKKTNNNFIDGLARWQIKNVGPSKVFDSKTHYWCPHHVKKGKWNGMYILHHPNQHKGKRAETDAAPAADPTKDSSQQDDKVGGTAAAIQLQSRLKKVMCANLCLISEDVDKLFYEAKN